MNAVKHHTWWVSSTGPAGGTVHAIDTVVRLTTGPASPAP